MGKFGDIDVAKRNQDLNARIKAMLMLLFQMFSGPRQNTADKIHNFIPHLKRTDRDCGSLPFYSTTFTSHKTNKEHVLLCMLSMVVQTYWDIVDANKISKLETLDEFSDVLEVLEEMSKGTFDDYRVHGPVLKFTLLSKKRVDEIEVEEAKAELAEAEHKEEIEQQTKKDAEEGKKLMEAALDGDTSGSVQSSSTDAAETEEAKNEDTQQEGSSEASSSDQQVASGSDVEKPAHTGDGNDTDQLSVEDADKCCGDCDNCADQACDVETSEASVLPADDEAGGAADSEQYPDVEPLEKTVTDAVEREDNLEGAVVGIGGALADEQGGKVDTVPPMPEEEKDSQAAVDHETGADQTDDDGDSQEAVNA